jgi:O-antigen chain-terminating methyltransferase
MIRSRNPKVDLTALEARIAEELAAGPQAGANQRLARLAATVHVRTIESIIERAEARAVPRAEWPVEMDVFPFAGNRVLQRLVLRVVTLIFRDQQEVNAQVIRAQREMLSLVHGLLERIEDLETRLESERATARAERIAKRHDTH